MQSAKAQNLNGLVSVKFLYFERSAAILGSQYPKTSPLKRLLTTTLLKLVAFPK